MNQVVFLELDQLDAVPFTTSTVIAECADVQHHTVTRLIQKHEDDFKEFGLLRFKIDAVKRERGTKFTKTYHLNEEQATLLLTYLQNTPQVRAFKKELVRQFYVMRTELQKQQIEREMLEPTRCYLPGTPEAEAILLKYFDSFMRWREENSCTKTMFVLYMGLLYTFSCRGWEEWISVKTPLLMLLANTTDPKTAYRARDALVEAGLIEYKPGKKRKPSEYRLLIRDAEKAEAD